MSLKMDIKHAAGCIIRSQNIGKLIFPRRNCDGQKRSIDGSKTSEKIFQNRCKAYIESGR